MEKFCEYPLKKSTGQINIIWINKKPQQLDFILPIVFQPECYSSFLLETVIFFWGVGAFNPTLSAFTTTSWVLQSNFLSQVNILTLAINYWNSLRLQLNLFAYFSYFLIDFTYVHMPVPTIHASMFHKALSFLLI